MRAIILGGAQLCVALPRDVSFGAGLYLCMKQLIRFRNVKIFLPRGLKMDLDKVVMCSYLRKNLV